MPPLLDNLYCGEPFKYVSTSYFVLAGMSSVVLVPYLLPSPAKLLDYCVNIPVLSTVGRIL